jgi:2-oxo-3-hexenedioate decarboxylase
MSWTVARMAAGLLDAADTGARMGPITAQWPELDLDTAYAIQDEALRMRLDRGERLVGIKVDQPGISGWLTDAMLVPVGGTRVPREGLIRPRATPQLVFQLASKLAGPGVTAAGALAAVAAVYCGLEVADSRFGGSAAAAGAANGAGGPATADVIADNASCCRFVTGPVARPPDAVDLTLEACLLDVGGQVVDSATGAAVHGHPAEALAFAANDLARRGLAIQPGWIVLTGAMTDAVPCPAGTAVAAHFTTLGSVFLSL